jgi:hypothetical protein
VFRRAVAAEGAVVRCRLEGIQRLALGEAGLVQGVERDSTVPSNVFEQSVIIRLIGASGDHRRGIRGERVARHIFNPRWQ